MFHIESGFVDVSANGASQRARSWFCIIELGRCVKRQRQGRTDSFRHPQMSGSMEALPAASATFAKRNDTIRRGFHFSACVGCVEIAACGTLALQREQVRGRMTSSRSACKVEAEPVFFPSCSCFVTRA
ncbi:hypothetical protein PHSY_002784 [Pseudozyma hubeiensis SY62]|uniref:Uncharacterized protein n=1 Tax=Pseudozyma hubeiensis (strain SY62) TaxID=1305764 RepID=R9P1W5_PSEHS|nr:hypothetical protein PHSY_002784 [Pseudozyma hubeiensis SY62]GAC95209.1 hypothetical protein PHSY_002784 [Pseudozyma hubeiensis SY62]